MTWFDVAMAFGTGLIMGGTIEFLWHSRKMDAHLRKLIASDKERWAELRAIQDDIEAAKAKQ